MAQQDGGLGHFPPVQGLPDASAGEAPAVGSPQGHGAYLAAPGGAPGFEGVHRAGPVAAEAEGPAHVELLGRQNPAQTLQELGGRQLGEGAAEGDHPGQVHPLRLEGGEALLQRHEQARLALGGHHDRGVRVKGHHRRPQAEAGGPRGGLAQELPVAGMDPVEGAQRHHEGPKAAGHGHRLQGMAPHQHHSGVPCSAGQARLATTLPVRTAAMTSRL